MVATISARKSLAAAQKYFVHLKQDDYYCAADATNSRWVGRASEILGLQGQVTPEAFGKALAGTCPVTSTQLVQPGRNHKKHVPGWDATLSAPKAVSLLWALAPTSSLRHAIEKAHKSAAVQTVRQMEEHHAWCRRGKGGRIKEKTAGLLVASFTHHTSRNLDCQLHEHLFVMNAAPRKDGTWGAIQSKPLYNAQKALGSFYREKLSQELIAINVPAKVKGETIAIDGISREHELAFSSRRLDILEAVKRFNYAHDAKGCEKAALRTRKSKQRVNLGALHNAWSERASALQFDYSKLYAGMQQAKEFRKADSPATQVSIPQGNLNLLVAAARKVAEGRKSLGLTLKKAAKNLAQILGWSATKKKSAQRIR